MNFSTMYLDLNKLFDWNVKQLFLYLMAEYTTPVNVSDDKHVWSSQSSDRRGESMGEFD